MERKLGSVVELQCNANYGAKMNPLTATCTEDTAGNGKWNVNGVCTCMNYITIYHVALHFHFLPSFAFLGLSNSSFVFSFLVVNFSKRGWECGGPPLDYELLSENLAR